MGSASGSFIDYYKFLGVASDAPLLAINQAITAWEERNNLDRVHPDLHRDVDRREHYLNEARELLQNPTRRRAYDEEYNRRVAQQGGGLLWLDPEFIFDSNDEAPAYTVPSLAIKLDGDWPRAIEAVKSRAVEQMLHFVKPRQPVAKQPRYAALETEIGRLRVTLGEKRPYQMLESTIVLCDERLPRAAGRVDGQPIAGAELAVQQVRPDRPQTARFRLQRATEVRGCLFGYVWIEDSWATITNPSPEAFTADGKTMRGAYFELVGDGAVDFTISMSSPALMELKRPETHQLHIVFGLQPGTSHYHLARCSMPVTITPIPAKAAFEPAQVALPVVRRGTKLTATARLVNKGEAPLNARRAPSTDSSVSVEDTLENTGGDVQVTVDTSNLPNGAPFEKNIQYQADGDIPSLNLLIKGELLPTPWQHLWRLQPARDRFTLAGVFALLTVFFGPVMAGLLGASPVAFWVIAGLALAGGAAAVARIIGRSVVRHIRASGDETVTEASLPQELILGGAGATFAIAALVLSLLPWEPWQKAFWFVALGALIAAVWGFFFNEDLAVYPRKPSAARALDSNPTPLSAGWKAAAVFVGVVLFIAGLAFDVSLVGTLLLLSAPIALVVTVMAARE